MGDQGITAINPLPEQTMIAAIPGTRLFVDAVNSGRNYKNLTGKRQLGHCDQKDLKFSLKPEFSPVTSGAVNIVLVNIIKGWQGKVTSAVQDLNINSMEVGNGTNIKTVDTQPTTAVTGLTHASTPCTKTALKMATGAAEDFEGLNGKRILIGRTHANSMPIRGVIRSVDTATDTINLLYELDEIPPLGATIALLEGFEQDLGGGSPTEKEIILAQDFNHGDSNRQVCWRCQPGSGFDQTQSNDSHQKQTIEFDLLGFSKQSAGAGGTFQIVPSTIYGLYGTIPTH